MTYYLASTYGNGAYGASTYQVGSTSTGTTTNTGTTSGSAGSTGTGGSVLTNTGFDVALAVTTASVILLTSVLVRFWKRPATKN